VVREIDDRSTLGTEVLLSMRQYRGLVPHIDVSTKLIPPSFLVGYKRATPNDLVLNRMQASNSMFFRTALEGVVSPDYAVFRPEIDVSTEYLGQLFRSVPMCGQFRAESKGLGTGTSGFLRLYSDRFAAIPIPLPPREEQDQIVAYLRAQDAQIARFIRDKRRLIEVLNEQKQTLIHRAVTRGLDPKARLRPSGIEWLGAVPEHWFVRRLKFVADNVTEQTDSQRDGEIYLALEHVESWTGKMSPPQGAAAFSSTVKRFKKDDVLFGKLRPYLAKVVRAQASGVCVSEFFVLRAKDAEVLPAYLELLLRTKKVIEIVNSSTAGAKMPRADWTAVGNLRLAFPPKTEQRRILSAVADETGSLDVASSQARGEITLMQEYRDRLIADVVTGQLDVRAWMPGPDDVIDETAAVIDDEDAMADEGAEDDDDGHE
jgi:type I restriction enzyme S subunit